MPHNLLISEEGKVIYLIVRDFDPFLGWLEFSGGLVCIEEPIPNEEEIIARKERLTKNKQFV